VALRPTLSAWFAFIVDLLLLYNRIPSRIQGFFDIKRAAQRERAPAGKRPQK
jgi:hypothetical protein